MATASCFDVWIPFIILIAIGVLAFGGRKGRWLLVAFAVGMTLSDGVVSGTLKRLVHRPRPYQMMADVREVDLDRHSHPRVLAFGKPLWVARSGPPAETGAMGRSFPSGHTMNNFCAATLLALFYRRWGWLYFFVATLVGYSRVYVGAHWPSDVLASAIMAVALTLGAAALLTRWRPDCKAPPGGDAATIQTQG